VTPTASVGGRARRVRRDDREHRLEAVEQRPAPLELE
jgi:hypothetical protein